MSRAIGGTAPCPHTTSSGRGWSCAKLAGGGVVKALCLAMKARACASPSGELTSLIGALTSPPAPAHTGSRNRSLRRVVGNAGVHPARFCHFSNAGLIEAPLTASGVATSAGWALAPVSDVVGSPSTGANFASRDSPPSTRYAVGGGLWGASATGTACGVRRGTGTSVGAATAGMPAKPVAGTSAPPSTPASVGAIDPDL
mmetsp:Transcript_35827/g.110410  ORF Transcript_35827/g.110410 Transcript_35827/m.110410 type:complete len:200 (+) Transcript_35827:101-700(+)